MSSDDAARVRGVLLTHGTMAMGAADAVERITGISDAFVPLSNEGRSPDALAALLRESIVPGEPTILFTDLQAGSCGFAARRVCRDEPTLVVVAGVNLPMLLDFALNRALPLEELVPRLVEKGRAAITSAAGRTAASDADRSASR